MQYKVPTCPKCDQILTGYPDIPETLRLAQLGQLKASCSEHGLVEIPLADQEGIAAMIHALVGKDLTGKLRHGVTITS